MKNNTYIIEIENKFFLVINGNKTVLDLYPQPAHQVSITNNTAIDLAYEEHYSVQ
ncbi:hypothetical protein [Pedobacter sp. CFBP9032]|uniref:hypothetical protein n=1 Tax=Pedobacter sp. CFBP9032 TaxID=3096539 RepID=UPI002A6AA2E4|nr:hypothetical protein [Pedobacter sp. CFBP9032]MDY0906588.1 hypothetical protein [Pedobacter sp. CFBP9032]